MSINTKSELIVDIDKSVKLAYDDSLSGSEQEKIKEHLSYVLTLLNEPNTSIPEIKAALTVMQSRQMKPWYEKPLGLLFIAVLGGLFVAGVAKYLGWG